MPKLLNSAIRINGKVYEGVHHIDAINKAKAQGEDISKVNKERDGLFRVDDGRLITREQSLKEFGIWHSEQLYDEIEFVVFDSGLYPEQANALSKDGKRKVYYTTSGGDGIKPQFIDDAYGRGFKGLKKTMYPYDVIDECHSVVNFDVSDNDFIAWYRRHNPDKSVVGCGLGQRLEDNRVGLKKVLSSVGLKYADFRRVKGRALEDYCKKNPDKFVKHDIFRGDVETFNSKYYKFKKALIDDSFGPFSDDYEFMVEDGIDTPVEIGFDTFFNGLDFCGGFYGYEYDKELYIGKSWQELKELPIPLQETATKLKPVLSKLDYRGPISTEEKIVSEKEHCFLDACMRIANPLGALYCPPYIKNWSDFIYLLGLKKNIRPQIPYKYVGAMPLHSDHESDQWIELQIDSKHRDSVKLNSGCQFEGKFYSVKGTKIVCILVAGGNTVDEVIKGLIKSAEYVDGYGLNKEPLKGIDNIKKIILQGQKCGISF